MKALSVEIFKSNFGDCSNGGISSKYNSILLLCEEGNIEVKGNEENLCKIVKWYPFGKERGAYYHVAPIAKPNGVGWMYGGTIVCTSDSRFFEMGNGYPLKLHDRCESEELYDELSR